MEKEKSIIPVIIDFFSSIDGIAAIYIHGSFLTSQSPNDLDIALLLNKDFYNRITRELLIDLDFIIPLEMELEARIKIKTDIQVVNNAPLPFRFSVVTTGKCIIDNDPEMREQYELLSRVEYFDFHPRIKEYLKEAFSS